MAQSRPFTRRSLLGAALLGATGVAAGCGSAGIPPEPGIGRSGGEAATPETPAGSADSSPSATAEATNAEIIARATVPVLCYHQVRPYESGDTSYSKQLLIIEPARFREQLDAIKGAGYTTITPDDYLAHLTGGAQLPEKPVILSFDDGKDNQPEVALAAVAERGMKATWFIMTTVIGNPGWTAKAQIRQMAEAGMTIGAHTWDHHDVRKYKGKDFTIQFDEPREKLRELSGQPVDTFAYPYGAWNPAALPHLEKAGYRTGFQLSDKPIDGRHPLMTLRRSLTASDWTGEQVVAKLREIAQKA